MNEFWEVGFATKPYDEKCLIYVKLNRHHGNETSIHQY